MVKSVVLLAESQEEVFIPGADISCQCKHGPEEYTICGNCVTNTQIAKQNGLYYDSDSGKFLKRA